MLTRRKKHKCNGLDEAQAGTKTAGRRSKNLRHAADTALTAEREQELKSLLTRWKKRVKKLAYHSTVRKLRSWHPVPIHSSWQIDGETGETVSDFIFLGSKITADGGYSHKIKRCLLLGRKVMTNLDSKLKSRDSILKSRDITLPTNVHLVKAMVFPVVMYGCKSWTIEKAECQRTDAFQLWYWRRLCRVPWTAGKSNQSIL